MQITNNKTKKTEYYLLQTLYYHRDDQFYAVLSRSRFGHEWQNTEEQNKLNNALIKIFTAGFKNLLQRVNSEQGDLAVGVMRSKFPDRGYDPVDDALRRFLKGNIKSGDE